MNSKELASLILEKIGGVDNIISYTHCFTRLRFVLRDEKICDTAALKNTRGIIGVVSSGGQYQIIIGSEVSNVYAELTRLTGLTQLTGDKSAEPSESSKPEKKEDKNGFIKVLETVAGIFTPIIPAITGAGILKAVMALLSAVGLLSPSSQTYAVLTVFADAAFYFLPFLLAYSAAKKFGCSIVLALSVAGILLHPSFAALFNDGAVKFFGIPVRQATYSSSVIPIILTVWFMSFIEPIADKISWKPIKFFTKPLITLVVTGFAGIVVIGPLGNLIGEWIALGIDGLDKIAPWLVPLVIGVFSPFLVMTGTHYGLIPIGINNIATAGIDKLIGPGMLGSNIAQGGASLAVAVKTHDSEMKQLATSAGITAICGITEPAMYGVNLKLKKPLIPVMIAGGAAGLYMGLCGVGRYTTGSPGLLALPGYIGTEGARNIINTCIAAAGAFLIGFVGTLIIYKDKSGEKAGRITILSPVKGHVVPLAEVNDPTFAEMVLGNGCAVIPENGSVFSPADGVVDSIPETCHAVMITTDNGAELLIHIGIDTVELGGRFFKALVKVGDRVKAGQKLIEFERESVVKAGYDVTTPVIVTNTDDFDEIKISAQTASEKMPLMVLTAKEKAKEE